jgi:hypothetical protein
MLSIVWRPGGSAVAADRRQTVFSEVARHSRFRPIHAVIAYIGVVPAPADEPIGARSPSRRADDVEAAASMALRVESPGCPCAGPRLGDHRIVRETLICSIVVRSSPSVSARPPR